MERKGSRNGLAFEGNPIRSSDVRSPVVTKFCAFGMVASKTWDSTFITIIGNQLKLYDCEESSVRDPNSFVMQIILTPQHSTTEMHKKNYSLDKSKVIDFYCFTIEVDNGIFAPTKVLKIGSLHEHVTKLLIDAIADRTRSSSV